MEYRTIAKLLELGFTHAVRSAGSHTPVDVYAWKGAQAYFFQVKSGKAKLSRKERMELIDLATDCGAIPVLVTKGMKFEWLGSVREAA
jgi:Holliday junction resolvase